MIYLKFLNVLQPQFIQLHCMFSRKLSTLGQQAMSIFTGAVIPSSQFNISIT